MKRLYIVTFLIIQAIAYSQVTHKVYTAHFKGDAQDQRAHGPGQQVAHHREAVPEHAQYRFRVLAHVLEHQAVQALVKLAQETIEIPLLGALVALYRDSKARFHAALAKPSAA